MDNLPLVYLYGLSPKDFLEVMATTRRIMLAQRVQWIGEAIAKRK